MTIARFKSNIAAPTPCALEGPYNTGNWPLPGFSIGDHASGDGNSEFIFVMFSNPTAVTYNQGDFFSFDNSFYASPVLTGAGNQIVGSYLGTLHLGGRIGQNSNNTGTFWSYNFSAGTYGIWLQVCGTSLGWLTSTLGNKSLATSPIAGRMDSNTAVGGSMTYSGAYVGATTSTVTGNCGVGSPFQSALTSNRFLQPGMYTTSNNFPPGTFLKANDGNRLTFSQGAILAGTQATTLSSLQAYGTTTLGSSIITNVPSISNVFPNQGITGNGIAPNAVIKDVVGNGPYYQIVLSAPCTATGSSVLNLAFYYEVNLNYPIATVQN